MVWPRSAPKGGGLLGVYLLITKSQEEINFKRKLTFGISKSQEEINFFDKKYCKKLIFSNPYFKKFSPAALISSNPFLKNFACGANFPTQLLFFAAAALFPLQFTHKKTNTDGWLIINFNINDAYFGSRGDMNSDFCLDSNDDKDDIFSFIQVITY